MIDKNKMLLKFLGVMVLLVTFHARAFAIDQIIAVVDEEAITLKDLKAYIASIYGQLRIQNQDPFEIDQIMREYELKGVNQLIEDKLILAAAKGKEITIRPQVIDKRIEEMKARYPSEFIFQSMLEQEGVTITDIRNKIIDQLKAKYMVDNEVRSKIFVNPQEVTDYYNAHKDDFIEEARINLDSIFIGFDQGLESAKKEAADVHRQLKEGKNFHELFKAHSDLPSVGTIEEGQLKPELERVVFNMTEDEISEPVEAENGIYIFKSNRKAARKVKSLQDAKDEIYARLFEEKFRNKFDEWINKLREKTYIEIRP